MLRQFKRFCWVLGLAATLPSAWGFALLGPINETYQSPVIGYGLAGDWGAPKNLGDEYRRNTPVMYYACDQSFLDYFGMTGMASVDRAFNVFNGLTNVSSYSSDLSEFPTESYRINGKAEALQLLDLKSWTMGLITEQLGMADPERWTWTLHNRYVLDGGTCPFDMDYVLVQRNFDPVFGTSTSQYKTTSYVNDVLFTYYIVEICSGPNPLAEAVEYPVDPTAQHCSAVASWNNDRWNSQGIFWGGYFTGLTRDDVGCLRYLLRQGNINIENVASNATLYATNDYMQLQTYDLGQLAAIASTNDAAGLALYYPDLVVTNTTRTWSLVTNVIVTLSFLTNSPYDPIGTAPSHPVYRSNFVYSLKTNYSHIFANAYYVTNTSPNRGSNHYVAMPLITVPTNTVHGVAATQSYTMTNALNAYTPVNSTTVWEVLSAAKFFSTNIVAGDFFTLTTSNCGISIDALTFAQPEANVQVLISWTNIVTIGGSTNTAGGTGGTGGNGNNGGTGGATGGITVTNAYVQYLYTFSTNRTYLARTVNCVADTPAQREGVEHIQFIRRDFDSLTGRLWYPVTNEYNVPYLTNGMLLNQQVRRVVMVPDFVLEAQDRMSGPSANPAEYWISYRTEPQWASANVTTGSATANGVAGPGTIDIVPQAVFGYNKGDPAYDSPGTTDAGAYVGEAQAMEVYSWGSYDGTTNEPTVYPNDSTVDQLERMQLISMTPRYFADGWCNVGWTNTVSTATSGAATNWVAPISWSFAPLSPGLPPGLRLTTKTNCAVIYGMPSQAGEYDFILRATDNNGTVFDRSFTIKINY